MKCERSILWCLFLGISLLLASPAPAQTEDQDRKGRERLTLRAGSLPSDFSLTDTVHEPATWAGADSIADLTTIEPEEGGVPAGRTVIKVLANEDDIVVAVRCYDNQPRGIVSFSQARDSELEEEDHVVIVFDTFLDARSGYVFAVNPTGARFDGLVTAQGEEVNGDWDTIWEAATSRDHAGWSAEMRIPIKSLGFRKNLTTWGFNVQRRVERLQETSRWSGTNLDYEIFQTSRAGLLIGLPDFDVGLGLSARPALVARAGKESGEGPEYQGDLSLDVTQKLGPNLLSALTVNTDFAETEVDVRQINLTRFPVFFPEKRSFFLEGADIFEFGLGLDEETLVPFFSRRIGLLGPAEEATPIPINVGGKINGRAGNTNLGALVVNTRTQDSLEVKDVAVYVPQTTMASLRVKQNVLGESALGMIATFGDQQGRSGSWSAGVDLTYQTSSFREDKNLLAGLWGLLNDREDLQGDRSAYGFRVDYPNDLLDLNLTSTRIGDAFDPSLGFVLRNDVHIWELSGQFNPRPSWAGVRQMFHELSISLFNDRSNDRWQSYSLTITPIDWLLESGDRFGASVEPQGDRPSAGFEVSDVVVIPPGRYEWTRTILGAGSAERRRISGQVEWETGGFYDGDLNTIEAVLALKPSPFLTLEFTGERNDGKVMAQEQDSLQPTATEFTEELFGARLQLNFSSDLQLSSFAQYDTESRELGSNIRLRWTFDTLGDVFLVYNHNVARTEDDRWRFVSNQLPLKIQYAWRF